MLTIKSIAAVEGLAAGTAFRLQAASPSRNHGPLPSLDEAFDAERRRLQRLCNGTEGIFAAHLEILEDPMLRETIDIHITEGMDPENAVEAASDELTTLFATIDDEYLRARADDVRDICRGLLNRLSGAPDNPWDGLPDDAVIVAEQLFPSDTAAMDFSKVRAFVTRKGSVTSHVAIIARSKGIPALLGVDIDAITEGDFLLVDGEGKWIGINPSEEERKAFRERMATREENGTETLLKPDGSPVRIYGNAGSIGDIRAALQAGADGIGLFRTEFIFMNADHFPTEEEQADIYREAVLYCNGKPLTIRLLDIGGDKALPYWDLPREENPFLGERGIRLSLAHPDMLKTQLRAILLAGAACADEGTDGPETTTVPDIRIMVPMVTTCGELRQVRELVREAAAELGQEGRPCAADLPVGIMVETPAAVLTAPELAREAAFFSIGTNDLTQYVMAADRGNPSVASLNDPMGPAVRKAIEMTVTAARDAGIPVGVCGEMAANASARKWLTDCGVDSLSLSSPQQIAKLKRR